MSNKNYTLSQLRGAWAAGKNSSETNPRVGKWFHSIEGGVINWQGKVLSELPDGRMLIQLYSWADGQPSNQKTIDASSMQNWRFYSSSEAMTSAYEQSIKGKQK